MISLEMAQPVELPQARHLHVLTAVSFTLLMLTAIWAMSDQRQLDGVAVWAKPMKFALSFVILFGTLSVFESRLTRAWQDGRMLRTVVAVMAAAMVTEMSYITVMAAQQLPSHFNLSTPFTAMMYSVMGVGAVLLIAGVAAFGVATLRDRDAALSPALRWGIGWGCILTFAMTLVTAGTMSSHGTHVGFAAPGSPVLPLLGWSASVGDMRPAHFLALHAMQVLPLVGLWFDRIGIPARRMRWVAVTYAILTAAIFGQALAGAPLWRL